MSRLAVLTACLSVLLLAALARADEGCGCDPCPCADPAPVKTVARGALSTSSCGKEESPCEAKVTLAPSASKNQSSSAAAKPDESTEESSEGTEESSEESSGAAEEESSSSDGDEESTEASAPVEAKESASEDNDAAAMGEGSEASVSGDAESEDSGDEPEESEPAEGSEPSEETPSQAAKAEESSEDAENDVASMGGDEASEETSEEASEETSDASSEDPEKEIRQNEEEPSEASTADEDEAPEEELSGGAAKQESATGKEAADTEDESSSEDSDESSGVEHATTSRVDELERELKAAVEELHTQKQDRIPDESEETEESSGEEESEESSEACGDETCASQAMNTRNAAEAAEDAAEAAANAATQAAQAASKIESVIQSHSDLVKKLNDENAERRAESLAEAVEEAKEKGAKRAADRRLSAGQAVEKLRQKIAKIKAAKKAEDKAEEQAEKQAEKDEAALKEKREQEKRDLKAALKRMSKEKQEKYKRELARAGEAERKAFDQQKEAYERQKEQVQKDKEEGKERDATIARLRKHAMEAQQKQARIKAALAVKEQESKKLAAQLEKQKLQLEVAKEKAEEEKQKDAVAKAKEAVAKTTHEEKLKAGHKAEQETKKVESAAAAKRESDFKAAQQELSKAKVEQAAKSAAIELKRQKEEGEKKLEKIKEEGAKEHHNKAKLKGEEADKAAKLQAEKERLQREKLREGEAKTKAAANKKATDERNAKKAVQDKERAEFDKQVAAEQAVKKAQADKAAEEQQKQDSTESKAKAEGTAKQAVKTKAEQESKRALEAKQKTDIATRKAEQDAKSAKLLKDKEAAEKQAEETTKGLAAEKKKEEETKAKFKAKQAETKAAQEKEEKAKAEQIAEATKKDDVKKAQELAAKKAEEAKAKELAKVKAAAAAEQKLKKGSRLKLADRLKPYGMGYGVPVYLRWGRLCMLSGVAHSNSNMRDVIAQLPEWCRPDSRVIFGQDVTGAITTRADVIPDGRVWVNAEGNKRRRGWFSFDGMLFAHKGAPTRAWALSKPWVNYGKDGYGNANYYIENDVCVLSGLIRLSNWNLNSFNSLFGTLPAACRPRDGRLIFKANHHQYSWRVDVLTDGRVYYQAGTRHHAWISLDGIAFAIVSADSPIDLTYGWSAYQHGYRKPSFKKIGNFCILSGLARAHSGNKMGAMAQLPAGCRPQGRLIFHVNLHQYTKRIDVLPDGRVVAVDGPNAHNWLPLDGIKFLVGGSTYEIKPQSTELTVKGLALVNKFKAYGEEYRTPRAYRLGDMCMLSGLMKTSSVRPQFTTVPEFCKPAPGSRIFDIHLAGVRTARVDLTEAGAVGWRAGYTGGNWMPLDGIVYPSKSAKLVGLHLQSPYVPYERGYAAPTYFKQGDFCVVSGLIRRNNFATMPGGLLLTLPADCRPVDGRLIFNLNHHQYTHRVDVLADGRVYWITGSRSHTWVSLDGLFFFTKSTNMLVAQNGFTRYAHSYRYPSFRKQGKLCAVSGLSRAHHWNHNHIATLPTYCRPQERIVFSVNNHQYFGRIDILPDGRIMQISASPGRRQHGWISLDGIAFITDYKAPEYVKPYALSQAAAQNTGGALSLTNGWNAYGSGYLVPRFERSGPLCFLHGLMRGDIQRIRMGNVPAECRPQMRHSFDVHVSSYNNLQFDVESNGNFGYRAGGRAGDWIPFDGIVYPRHGAKTNELQLQHMWTNVGGEFPKASFVRQGDFCVFQGRIKIAPWSTNYWHRTLLIAPPECRPMGDGHMGGRLIFHINSREHSHRVDLLRDGRLYWVGGGRAVNWLSLDGIAFFRNKMRPLHMTTGWQPYAHGYRYPSYRKQGVICSLSGLARDNGNSYFARIGSECYPQGRLIFSVHVSNGNCRIDILPNGQIHRVTRHGGWVSLDGVRWVVRREYSAEEKNTDGVTVSKAGKALTLLNGFTVYGQGWRNPVYTVDKNVCALSGTVQASNIRATITVLPAECRPKGRHVFNLNDDYARTMRVDVLPNGQVRWQAGYAAGHVSLDGITFVTSKATTSALKTSGWYVPYGKPYAPPSYTLQGDLCIVSGMLRHRHNAALYGGDLVQLPADCRPKNGRLIFHLNHGEYSNRVDVLTDGRVHWIAGGRTHSWISLDGIAFLRQNSGDGLSFRNGYNNYNHGYRQPSYKRVGNMCILSGLVRGASVWPIARLPLECRPSERLSFGVNNHQYTSRLDVWPDGRLVLAKNNHIRHGWVSVDGIKYFVDPGERSVVNSVYGWEGFKVAKQATLHGWSDYHSSYGVTMVHHSKYMCMLSGLMKVNHVDNYKTTWLQVPKDCLPQGRLVFDMHGPNNVHSGSIRGELTSDGKLKYAGGPVSMNWLPIDGLTWAKQTTKLGPVELWYKWRSNGQGYAKVGWYRQGNFCFLQGLIRTTHFNRWIGQLPPACRPRDGRTMFRGNHMRWSWRLDVLADGRIYADWYHFKYNFVSLQDIKFPVERGAGLSFRDGWRNYGYGWRAPTYSIQGNYCMMSGLARGGGHTIAVLPSNCRPHQRLIFSVCNHQYVRRVDVLPDGRVLRVNGNSHGWLSMSGIMFRRQ